MQPTLQSKIKVVTIEYNENLNLVMPHIKTLQNTLKDMRRIVNCHYVTCTEIEIEGKKYDVWSDDEALLVEKPVPTLYINEDLVLFGNLIFATSDEESATKGLDDEDMDRVLKFINAQFPKLVSWLKHLRKNKEHNNFVPKEKSNEVLCG